MGLLNKFGLNAIDFEQEMTEEDIDILRANGADVTELTEKLEQKKAEQKRISDEMQARIDLEMLSQYKNIPRSLDSKLIKDIAGKPPIFGKDKWLSKFQNAQIIYCAIVQANNDLWSPGKGEYLPAVLVYTDHKTLRYDLEWLQTIAKKIMQLKDDKDIPSDCKQLIKTLRDDESMFFYKVGDSITEGVNTWCQTYSFPKQSNLPNKCLPLNGIIPFLLDEKNIKIFEIPSNYYMKESK